MPESINQPRRPLSGSALLALSKALLTDAAPAYSEILACAHCNDVSVDVIADKACSIVIIPVLDVDDDNSLGLPSATGTVDAGGGVAGVGYTKIRAPKAKIIVTKTEAGDCTETIIAVRGNA